MAALGSRYHDDSNHWSGIAKEELGEYGYLTIAVADVFDALISKRIYKDAMPLEKAYAIIREESGTHFEPETVEAFMAFYLIIDCIKLSNDLKCNYGIVIQ